MKLELEWVSNTIGEDYKKWRPGDIILLEAQTGTGKTEFIKTKLIDYMSLGQEMLFVCNRTNLKRQLKIALLNKYGKEIPIDKEGNTIDWDRLDKITKINNIMITSYHAIQKSLLNEMYGGKPWSLDTFDYIILDECHYILTDGSFNNKCRLAYQKLIKQYQPQAIKIFISATMEELRKPILNNANKIVDGEPYQYTTGIDYSYLDVKYFDNDINIIITTIKNDISDAKWLIFVSKKEDAKYIMSQLDEDQCSIIISGTKSKELDSIYQIINTETNEVYAGHSTNIQKRWSNHKRYLDLGEHSYETLNNGWIKDVVKFEILEECDEHELQEREDYFIKYLELVGFTVINKNRAGKSFRNSSEGKQAKSSSQTGKLNGNCRLSEQDIYAIRQLYGEGYSLEKLADMFGVTESHINNILTGRRWSSLK